MANPDAVSQLYLDSFGNVKVASATSVSLAATGNAVVTLPLVRGGLTNGGAVSNSGGVIIRKITVTSPAGDVSTANLAISSNFLRSAVPPVGLVGKFRIRILQPGCQAARKAAGSRAN